MQRMTGTLLAALVLAAAPQQSPPAEPSGAPPRERDRIEVVLPAGQAALLEGGPRAGRVILMLISQQARLDDASPVDGPFFEAPQPIYSVPVESLAAGKVVVVGQDAAAFPCPLDELTGTFRVQAVFDRNGTERSHQAPGNLLSGEQTIELNAARADVARLELTSAIEARPLPSAPNLQFVSIPSPMLSQAMGRDVSHRVGVALPRGWNDPSHRRRFWPAVYVVPGFGGDETDAESLARMLASEGSEVLCPQAVWIVLNPDSEWGHHGFVDSAANGPRGRALVEELIPELERRFRLIARPEARIVTGHSSGGWSSLWLQLRHPDFFGACFSSAPDPVDFSAFQKVNLYADQSYFSDAEGRELASYRTPIGPEFDKVRMTTREETGMEHALSPEGRSGEQLDAYAAMYSSLDPTTKLPRRAWNPSTGLIDRVVVENDWSRFDIARMVRANPRRHLPTLRDKVRLLVGARDNFYLERAVERLKAAVTEASSQAPLPAGSPVSAGYIEIVPEATHFSLPAISRLRWFGEMRDYLRAHGLD
jgi:hypothetical protein